MDSLKDILSDVKIFMYGGMLTLPITMAGTMLIIGLFTANYAMLFFLLGFLIATPLLAFLINLLAGVISDEVKVKIADTCRLAMPFSTLNSNASSTEPLIISEWLAMMSFFIGYMGMNAVQLMFRDSQDLSITLNKAKVETGKQTTRMTQAWVAIGSIIIVFIGMIAFRFFSNCEVAFIKNNPLLFIPTALLMGGFVGGGMGWYQLLSKVGQDRLSDLFGIANRLLTPGAVTNAPIACVPQP
jgi:hypothetical protein